MQSAPVGPVPNTLFSMHVHSEVLQGMPWPSVGIGGIRLWDTHTNWSRLNPARGVYDWTQLDSWLSLAASHDVDVLYTFGDMPTWASSNPTGTCDYNAGACYPPTDIQDWDDFVRAIVNHAAGRIKYWELWNEPNLHQYWSGGVPALVTMAQRAYNIIKSVDPTAIVLTPSPTGGAGAVSAWLGEFFSLGGGAYADVVAFHGYPTNRPVSPESINEIIDSVSSTMSIYGQSSKPVWDTEASWGPADRLPGLDEQAAYVARSYILHWSRGIPRLYWYAWNDGVYGTLWNAAASSILEPGIAYAEVYHWLVGATLSTPCSMTADSTWICGLTRPGGYEAEIVWNTLVKSPATVAYTPRDRFDQYRDLHGNVVPITGAIQVGSMPILLEQFEAVSLSQTSLTFDSPPTGTSSNPRTITLTNIGRAPLLIPSIETSGDYAQTNTCGESIAIGANCTISVGFTPTAAGQRIGAMSIHDNAPGTPHTVFLSNTGATSDVIFSPTDVIFPGQPVGTMAPPKTVMLINARAEVLTISRIEIEGVHANNFVASGNTCGTTVPAGASCAISVSFSPGGTGNQTATLKVSDTASPTPRTAALSGTGWDFSLQAASDGLPSARITAGQAAAYNLQAMPLGGFAGPIALSVDCGDVPRTSYCAATPNWVTLTGSSPVSFAINVETTPAAASPTAAQFVVLGIFLILIVNGSLLRQHGSDSVFAVVLLLLLLLVGCAGITGSNGGQTAQGLSSGAHTIVVTGISQGVTRTLNLTLVVQ